jgi:hypothetical protein
MSLAHASLTIIRITQAGKMLILSVGDVGHLPPSMTTGQGGIEPQLAIPTDKASETEWTPALKRQRPVPTIQ